MLLTYILDIILVINIFLAIIIVFFERRNPNAALAWVVLLIFFSVAGFILYLLFGQNFYKKHLFRLKEQDDRRLHAVIAGQLADLRAHGKVFGDPELNRFEGLVSLLLSGNRAFLTRDNTVSVYTTGPDKFNALLEAIEGATDHIHMEYYLLRDDETGKQVLDALARKASEGVEVRWLYDALGCARVPRWFYQDLQEAGGHIAPFFPSRIPWFNIRFNYRNHRKIAIIDGKTGFIGGYNIGNEYLGKGPLGNWRDTHVRIQGTAVSALQLRFLLDWNFAAKDDLAFTPRYFPDQDSGGTSAIQVISGGPDVRWSPVKETYLKLVTSAKRSILIQSPYFIPDESVLDALRIASLSGVDVRIMIPRKADHPFVHWSSYSFVGDLLDAGIHAYCYENGFLHAKTIVVDEAVCSVGSANWDMRSFMLNFEANAIIYDRAVAYELADRFREDIRSSSEVTREIYRNRDIRTRFKESVSRLMSPIL